MSDPYALNIYIDGSAFKNPGHSGGLAGIAEFPETLNLENHIIFQQGYNRTTNNRMELRACIKAFEYICESAKRLKINRAIIYTDSDYVHSNQARCEFWKKDKWRNKSGRPVENGDLWKQFILIKYRSPVRTEIQWIKGKSTAVVKAVDKAAKQAAKNPNKIDDSGYRSGRVARTKVVEKGGPSLFPAEGQMCIIRIYKREYRGAGGDQKVTFDLYSNGEFVSKYCAYLMEKSKIEIHRHQFYQVKFNTGPKYPLIVKARLLKPNSKLLK